MAEALPPPGPEEPPTVQLVQDVLILSVYFVTWVLLTFDSLLPLGRPAVVLVASCIVTCAGTCAAPPAPACDALHCWRPAAVLQLQALDPHRPLPTDAFMDVDRAGNEWEEAYGFIDMDALSLLFGMMVLERYVHLTTLPSHVERFLIRGSMSAYWLVFKIFLFTCIVSPLLTNDVVQLAANIRLSHRAAAGPCTYRSFPYPPYLPPWPPAGAYLSPLLPPPPQVRYFLTPLVVDILGRMHVKEGPTGLPHLLAISSFSNIASQFTPIGNASNGIVWSKSGVCASVLPKPPASSSHKLLSPSLPRPPCGLPKSTARSHLDISAW
eukprot:gene3792-4188_t